MTSADSLHCQNLIREHAQAQYYCTLLLPPHEREAVTALLALDVELRLIAAKVGEEMIAHIRYAWWREGLEAIAAGKPAREHPVLKMLGSLQLHVSYHALVDEVQEHWPDFSSRATRHALALCSEAVAGNAKAARTWQKAQRIVRLHETKHGQGKGAWLAFKLLVFAR